MSYAQWVIGSLLMTHVDGPKLFIARPSKPLLSRGHLYDVGDIRHYDANSHEDRTKIRAWRTIIHEFVNRTTTAEIKLVSQSSRATALCYRVRCC